MREVTSVGACVAMSFAAWCCAAAAEDMTVFGIPLGAALQIEECEKTVVGTMTLYQTATAICFQRIGSSATVQDTSPIENESILIRYPETAAPPVMSGGTAIGRIRDRNLDGVRFNTRGVDSQDQVLDTLTQRFGKPTALVPKQVQNSLGTTFDVFDASWTLPQVEILFRSVTSRVDTGFLNIDLKKAGGDLQQPPPEAAKDERRESQDP